MSRVLVIGAGLGGIGLAVRLKRAGVDFVVFEKSAGPGGVWWDNRYPGAAVDVPSAFYSYSFKRDGRWERTHATAAELRAYVGEVIDAHDLASHLRFGVEVRRLTWCEDEQQWAVTTDDGVEHRFGIVISAVGLLNVPNLPRFLGAEDYAGTMFHTSRWPDGLALEGKRVAYIGAGSTSAQVVPSIAREVAELHVIQREPHWVLPKVDPPVTAREGAGLAGRWKRWRAFGEMEKLARISGVGSKTARQLEAIAQDYLRIVTDPQVRAALTPAYPFLCKRPVQATPDYFESFNQPHVHLAPAGVERLTSQGLVTTDGVRRDVDVIICGTGFRAADYLSSLEVIGRGGRKLRQVWDEAGGPYALLGLVVPDFPNLFMISGPSSHVTTSAIFVGEQQAKLIVRVLRRMRRRGYRTVEARDKVTRGYVAWVDRALATHPSAVGGCHNYFVNVGGKIVTLFPSTAKVFWLMCRLGDRVVVRGR